MTSEELKNISFNTPVYHPFLGEGRAVIIDAGGITVSFPDVRNQRFDVGAALITDRRNIMELSLVPMILVPDPTQHRTKTAIEFISDDDTHEEIREMMGWDSFRVTSKKDNNEFTIRHQDNELCVTDGHVSSCLCPNGYFTILIQILAKNHYLKPINQ